MTVCLKTRKQETNVVSQEYIIKKKKRVFSGLGAPIKGSVQRIYFVYSRLFWKSSHGGPAISISRVVDRTSAARSISKNKVIKIGKGKCLLGVGGCHFQFKKRYGWENVLDAVCSHIYTSTVYITFQYRTTNILHVTVQKTNLFTCCHSPLGRK